MSINDLDKTAIGPLDEYCDGYGNPGAQGLGYVSTLKVTAGMVEKTDDLLLDGIVAYDRAEADGAYIGQINMMTASSFCGIAGQVWGYDLAVADEIQSGEHKPLFTEKQYDGTPLPVYDAQPLLNAAQALFGTEDARRFPLAPGAHVICANKGITVSRPANDTPDPSQDQAYGVWSYIALSIAKDRKKAACLFIEDAGQWNKNDNEQDLVAFLDNHRKSVVWSIMACGKDQDVVYDRTYISYAHVIIPPGYIGTAITVGPYIVLTKKAVPNGQFRELNNMNLTQWEQAMGL